MTRTWHRPATGALLVGVVMLASGCRASGTPTTTTSHSSSGTPSSFRGLPDNLPGNSTGACVDVDNHKDVRSGGIVAGNFRLAKQQWRQAYGRSGPHTKVKIYWDPLHTDQMPGVTVRVTRTTGTAMSRTMVQPDNASTSQGALFYPSATPIPAPGTWRLQATAGPDRGCFLLTVHAAK